jgi:hypothetical protein
MLHDNLHPRSRNEITDALEGLIRDLSGGPLAPYDTTREALFGVLVAGVGMYVDSIVAAEADGPLGAPQALATLAADAAMLGDPDSFADADRVRYETHLKLTLLSLQENLEP